jgi:hypothetical protein
MNLNQFNNIKSGSVNNVDNRGINNTAIDNKKVEKKGIFSKIFWVIKKIFS